jgi:hypothetical protein
MTLLTLPPLTPSGAPDHPADQDAELLPCPWCGPIGPGETSAICGTHALTILADYKRKRDALEAGREAVASQ